MTLLAHFRTALRPAKPSRPLLLVTGFVAIGLLLLLCHVAAASPLEHADCAVCKTLQHVLVIVERTVAFSAGTFVLLRITFATAASHRPCRRRSRAPPFSALA